MDMSNLLKIAYLLCLFKCFLLPGEPVTRWGRGGWGVGGGGVTKRAPYFTGNNHVGYAFLIRMLPVDLSLFLKKRLWYRCFLWTFKTSFWWWWWWWIIFVVWLTDERRIALFPAETIVRDPHNRESSTLS